LPKNYPYNKCSVIRNFKKHLRQKRNLDSLSTARLSQIYVNAHKKEESQPVELVQFLPHPEVWIALNQVRKLKISRRTAIAILSTLDKLDDDIRDIVEVNLQEIQLIANGD
jgi:hypothetical protein